jgi:leucyl aminopeptidase
MRNNDSLAQKIYEAGLATGEQVWRLPMPKSYRALLKSSIADIKNSGERSAGAITAAIFLKEFVGNVPWAHLDIAGTAYLNKPSSLAPFQATAFGVRLLTHLFQGWSK